MMPETHRSTDRGDLMARDAFISYSSQDRPAADAVLAALETAGVSCWMAPRDVTPGTSYAQAIIAGIGTCRLFILLFSSASSQSAHVFREVERAGSRKIPLLPVRLENVLPQGEMEYFISSAHWLDAFGGSMEP